MITPYEELANAIILSAVKDYRKAKRGYSIGGKSADTVISSCERFFRSSWFMVLTDLDGEVLIEKLRKEFQ